MINEFGAKELYEVSLKTTDNIVINNQQYEPDEVFMFFNKVQISNISASGQTVSANGGKNNFAQVIWDNINELDFIFEKGLVNLTSLQFLGQSNTNTQTIAVPIREALITDTEGKVLISNIPNTNRSIFVYKTVGGIIAEKLTVLGVTDQEIDLGASNQSIAVLIDYYTNQENITYQEIGGENIKGYFKMTSKINFVDEKDGDVETVLFIMPKVKILSNINLTFGVQANPIISNFRIRALPDQGKTLGRFIFLRSNIEG